MKINVGTKDELKVAGYRPNAKKKAATVLLCLASGGLLLLLLSWKKKIRIKFTHDQCDVRDASVLLLTDIYDQVWEEKVEEESSPSSERAKAKQKYFHNKKIKYLWDDEDAIFSKLRYPMPGTRLCDLRQETSLTSSAAADRKKVYGENTTRIEIPTIWKLFVSQAYNPFYIFQVYTIIVWSVQTYYIYAGCIFFLSVVSIVLSIWETRRQARELRAKMISGSKVNVIRDNKIHVLDSKEVVPGDVVLVRAGKDVLEADLVLLEGSCIINEAILTGESVPITKVHFSPNDDDIFHRENHKRHILHCGTQVMQVRGGTELKALVTGTGYSTVKGEMIRSILFPKPIDFQIYSDFLRLIFIFFLLGCVAMIWSLVHWIQQENVTLTTAIFNSIDLLTFVIPPIIPATITAINLWAQKRLQKNKIFCLSSNYINLAGPVDLVCFDKTGTLTEDDLSLEGVLPCENSEFLPAINDLCSLPNLSKFTQTMATCHSVAKTPDGGYLGHPLDIKIFTALGWKLADAESMESSKALFSVSKEVNETDCEYEIFKTYPFESVEQRMTTIAKDTSTTSYEVFIKGAPEKIASICSQYTVPYNFSGVLDWYTTQGLRIVAAAYKPLPNSFDWEKISNTDRVVLEEDAIFLGLIILQNRLKVETSPALNVIHQALIATVMVTGDNLLTATSVARQCGLVKKGQQIIFVKAKYVASSTVAAQHLDIRFIDSDQSAMLRSTSKLKTLVNNNYVFGIDGESFKLISQYDKEVFKRVVHRGKIFARMKPDQKIEVIEALQALGHQVAMCGDGCNDCGALKAAHAGISLSSTEASVAAPFTSLQHDIGCVSTLIREGRATLISTYVSFKYNIAYGFAALTVVLFIFTVYTEPSDTQYLIMDLVLITVPSLVMGNTGASSELSKERPTRRIVHPLHITSIISFLGFQTFLFWATWKYLRIQPWFEPFILISDTERQPPGYESTVIIMQSFFTFIVGAVVFSQGHPFRKPFYTNKILSAYLIFSTVLCIIFTFCQVDWLYKFIDFKPIPYNGFTWTVFLSALLMAAICVLWERWFLYGFIEKCFVPWVMRLWGPRLPFECLEQTLISDSNWPKLNDEKYNNDFDKSIHSKITEINVEDFNADEDSGKQHGFYRKSTKRHKFTAEVNYAKESEPLIDNHEKGNNIKLIDVSLFENTRMSVLGNDKSQTTSNSTQEDITVEPRQSVLEQTQQNNSFVL